MAFLQVFRHPSRNLGFRDPFPILHSDDFEHMDALSSGLAQPFGWGGGLSVDWVETPESHVFKADLPGLSKEEIKVEVLDGKTLKISGERKNEKVQEKDSWRCVERSYGKFRRQFGLPENANAEEVAAKMEDGVLTVTIPKITMAKSAEVHSIDIA